MTQLPRFQIAMFALLLTSVAINGLQGTRILKLEDALDTLRPSDGLAEGKALPPLDLTDRAGKRVVIDYRSDPRPTLLYVLSPSCIWCRRNSDSFKVLSQRTKNIRILGLSLSSDGIDAFTTKAGIDFPTYTPSPSTITNYHLGETPTTILMSRDGTVVKIWSGAYTGLTKKSIESYFKVDLPAS